MLLLEQDMTRKGQMIEYVPALDTSYSEEYKVEAIWDNEVYIRESEGHLPLGVY